MGNLQDWKAARTAYDTAHSKVSERLDDVADELKKYPKPQKKILAPLIQTYDLTLLAAEDTRANIKADIKDIRNRARKTNKGVGKSIGKLEDLIKQIEGVVAPNQPLNIDDWGKCAKKFKSEVKTFNKVLSDVLTPILKPELKLASKSVGQAEKGKLNLAISNLAKAVSGIEANLSERAQTANDRAKGRLPRTELIKAKVADPTLAASLRKSM